VRTSLVSLIGSILISACGGADETAPGILGAGGGASGSAGSTNASGSAGSTNASGGTAGGGASGTSGASGGTSGASGGGAGGTFVGGDPFDSEKPPLDCGVNGVAIENAGPVENRVNYVILGDGYDATTVDTTFLEHIDFALQKRFSDVIGQPYGRYRKFVNICAIKVVSPSNGIGNGPTALSCSGDDQSRLANCNTQAADKVLDESLPPNFEVDWHAIVLNNDRWWNTGSAWMLWSGAHEDADGAALHEGGHGFHHLADEYGGSNGGCNTEYVEVNSTADGSTSAGKWDLWKDFDQAGATGKQGFFEGSRYCDSGQYRPSQNSMMNLLFGDDGNTAFNAVSREKIIMDIWSIVVPVDSTDPPEGDVSNPSQLKVNVIDPEVISVDWSIDGNVIATNGGPVFDVSKSGLPSGTYTIAARAYDNADETWVRYRSGECPKPPPSTNPGYIDPCWARDAWKNSEQTVTWKVTVP
jgi:hypothetical protein